jgi:TraG-like protein, N-terminal region
MNVGSYLELYTTVFGWLLYDNIWDVLSETGLVYLPFIGMLVRNFAEPYRSQEAKDAATTSLRRTEIDTAVMLTVVVLAAQPFIDVSLKNLSYTKACGAGGTVSGGSSGTTYDGEFTPVALGNDTAQVPVWWYGVLALTGGLDDAIILAIPCTAELRAMKYGIENSRVTDPETRYQSEWFYQNCFVPAMVKFEQERPSLPAGLSEEDIQWIGSEFFVNTPGYYDTFRSGIEVPGFPYDPSRDIEYDPDIYTPVNGSPTCKEWWNDGNKGLRQALKEHVEPTALDNFRTLLPASVGGITQAQAEDLAIRAMLEQEQAALTGLDELEAYTSETAGGIVSRDIAKVGALLESFTFYPKLHMIQVAAPVIQSMVLMMFYALLPFALLFSSYSIGTIVQLSIILFAIKFWTVLWAIAHWLDDHLLTALQPDSWYRFYTGSVTPEVIDFTTGIMFVALPIFWFGLLGWAGTRVGGEISSAVGQMREPNASAGSKGGQQIKKTAGRGKLV